jgi:predicted SpoU family rRNA methylase
MNFCHVLRMGHRPERDKRITTHVALTSRAFGATKMYLHRSDSRVIETVNDAEKVPPWVFEYSDFNIAIGSQPHSEVSALAIALSKISDDSYNQKFEGPIQVVPSGERRNMVDISKSKN